MKFDEMFIESANLPQPLSKEELYSYFNKYRHGDLKARDIIITHNIRLVISEVNRKFENTLFEKRDLVSVGIIGLMKSVDTFDIDKNYEFATYAVRCIDNEILMYLRKSKRMNMEESLETTVSTDKDGNTMTLIDVLEDKNSMSFVSKIEDEMIYDEVKNIINTLNDRDKEIISLYFGLVDNHEYTQYEIAKRLEIAQSYVSKLISKILKKIKRKLEQTKNTDLVYNLSNISESIKKSNLNQRGGRTMKTIYRYLNGYTKEQIDTMLLQLNDQETELLKLRYGDDLNNPVTSSLWDKEKNSKFYGTLVPKMKRLLASQNSKVKQYINENKKVETNKESVLEIKATTIENQEIIKDKNQDLNNKTKNNEIQKEDFMNILKLMKTPGFEEMLKVLTPKEAVIICLKLGYIDGKYFTTESIAKFLQIDKEEIIETTKKILLLYKDNINEFIDNTIKNASNDSIDSQENNNFVKLN